VASEKKYKGNNSRVISVNCFCSYVKYFWLNDTSVDRRLNALWRDSKYQYLYSNDTGGFLAPIKSGLRVLVQNDKG